MVIENKKNKDEKGKTHAPSLFSSYYKCYHFLPTNRQWKGMHRSFYLNYNNNKATITTFDSATRQQWEGPCPSYMLS
jgi:hypothetical protein